MEKWCPAHDCVVLVGPESISTNRFALLFHAKNSDVIQDYNMIDWAPLADKENQESVQSCGVG